jgi:signal transduction histidine kinase
LLALARLEAGQESLRRSEFDLAQLAGECLESVRPLAEERKVSLEHALAPTRMAGDPERLAQVVTNLLTNAIQHNRPGGEVRIALEHQGGVASLTVSDHGPGISAADLPHVFERFYRADPSRSTGGNGLGLAIVKAIVEAHGGTVEAASTPGQGATFKVRLPA